jgi:hypothetical protein
MEFTSLHHEISPGSHDCPDLFHGTLTFPRYDNYFLETLIIFLPHESHPLKAIFLKSKITDKREEWLIHANNYYRNVLRTIIRAVCS